jgi:hypothetical protein
MQNSLGRATRSVHCEKGLEDANHCCVRFRCYDGHRKSVRNEYKLSNLAASTMKANSNVKLMSKLQVLDSVFV